MNIIELRDGIFALRTRRFGRAAEIMIKKLFNFEFSHSLAYDLYDAFRCNRVETKFATVMEKNNEVISEKNVIEQCIRANLSNRAVKFESVSQSDFDCNIQQIKCIEFDVLYYGLFFADIIKVFRMTSEEILKYEGYSNKQHRNNEGEGQFHINNTNLLYHIQNFFIRDISYEDLYRLLGKESN